MAKLPELAKSKHSGDHVTKPLWYYEIYEQALLEEELSPKSILEIGVYQGESTKILAQRFPSARIVALDLKLRDIDFSGYDNIRYLQCDQTDQARLESICEEHFPNGLDLVIDDASHIGHFSRLTFGHVFPHLNSGGLYIVEDWGTGYWETWVDGGRFSERKSTATAGRIPKTIQSHNLGMVGFVKSLVDYTATGDIEDVRAVLPSKLSRFILSFGRFNSLRRLVEKTPAFRSWLVRYLDLPKSAQDSEQRRSGSELPRLKSVKFFRGVCIACKA
jgi:hypothetical protein